MADTGRPGRSGRDSVPSLRCTADADHGRPRQVAALPDGAHDRAARAARSSTRCTSASASAAGCRRSRSSCRQRRSSPSTRTSPPTRIPGSSTRGATSTDHRALALGPESLVVELASNDGYLLQHFLRKGIPVLGVEPARNVAEAAVARGVPTLTEFFGAELGAAARRRARPRGPRARQQRPCAGAGHQRLRRRRRGAARARTGRRRSSSRTSRR